MKQASKTIGLILLTFLFVGAALFADGYIIKYIFGNVPQQKLGASAGYPYYGVGNNTSTLCANSSTLLIGTSTGSRQYLKFGNTAPTAMYLSLGAPATIAKGLILFASSTLDFTQNPIIYDGPVYCISAGGSATVTVEELN